MAKEDKKKTVTKKNEKKKVVTKKTNKESFIKLFNKEIKLVKWPSIKEMVKYTVATIIFCVVFALFFILLNLIMAYVKGIFS